MPESTKTKKGRKIGRHARRPSTNKRKTTRPDLFKKARNVARSVNTAEQRHEALEKWSNARYMKEGASIAIILRKAKEKALKKYANRAA